MFVLLALLIGIALSFLVFPFAPTPTPTPTPTPPTPTPTPPTPTPTPPTPVPPTPSKSGVFPVQFKGGHQYGDLIWMVQQPEYADALFIFNDNQEQFLDGVKGDPSGCSPGGGNGALRPWQCKTPPRATGIPTGSNGAGYSELSGPTRAVIDQALKKAQDFINQYHYQRVFYNADGPDGMIGSHIFTIGSDVKAYITRGLKALVVSPPTPAARAPSW